MNSINSVSLGLGQVSKKEPSSAKRALQTLVNKFFKGLSGQAEVSAGDLSKTLVKDIVVGPRKEVLECFKVSHQEILSEFVDKTPSLQNDLWLAEMLALIPYTYPKIGATFNVPVKTETGYEMVHYKVSEVIEMRLVSYVSPMTASILTAVGHPPLLIFMGTTFPAAQGFLTTLAADFTPFCSVGKLPYYLAHTQIKTFFEKHSNVELYGKSLGGSLVFHTLMEFTDKIKRAYAVVPAGLYGRDLKKKIDQSALTISTQAGDIVSKMGYFPEGSKVKVFHISPEKNKQPGRIVSHAQMFAGRSDVKVTELTPKKANQGFLRRVLTVLHFAFGWIIATLLFGGIVVYSCYTGIKNSLENLRLQGKKHRLCLPRRHVF